MKKTILSFLLVFTTITAFAQDLRGTWSGDLHVGPTTLPLVLHVNTDDKGVATCTMDSPAQGAKDIPTKVDFISNDSLAVSVTMISAKTIRSVCRCFISSGLWRCRNNTSRCR